MNPSESILINILYSVLGRRPTLSYV